MANASRLEANVVSKTRPNCQLLQLHAILQRCSAMSRRGADRVDIRRRPGQEIPTEVIRIEEKTINGGREMKTRLNEELIL